jgi:hypothetical protein
LKVLVIVSGHEAPSEISETNSIAVAGGPKKLSNSSKFIEGIVFEQLTVISGRPVNTGG